MRNKIKRSSWSAANIKQEGHRLTSLSASMFSEMSLLKLVSLRRSSTTPLPTVRLPSRNLPPNLGRKALAATIEGAECNLLNLMHVQWYPTRCPLVQHLPLSKQGLEHASLNQTTHCSSWFLLRPQTVAPHAAHHPSAGHTLLRLLTPSQLERRAGVALPLLWFLRSVASSFAAAIAAAHFEFGAAPKTRHGAATSPRHASSDLAVVSLVTFRHKYRKFCVGHNVVVHAHFLCRKNIRISIHNYGNSAALHRSGTKK